MRECVLGSVSDREGEYEREIESEGDKESESERECERKRLFEGQSV